jgi:hypothetical protein
MQLPYNDTLLLLPYQKDLLVARNIVLPCHGHGGLTTTSRANGHAWRHGVGFGGAKASGLATWPNHERTAVPQWRHHIYRKALSVTNCVTLLIWSHDLKHPDQMEYCAVTEWEISEG